MVPEEGQGTMAFTADELLQAYRARYRLEGCCPRLAKLGARCLPELWSGPIIQVPPPTGSAPS